MRRPLLSRCRKIPERSVTASSTAALILPLSAGGNAGLAAQSMKNAAELALAEFNSPDVQLVVKDDGGNTGTARLVAEQAMDEGCQIILGPLFAPAVRSVGQTARQRGIPVIAFSTDASIAARGIYLLSFLPESDVVRVLSHAFSAGKRSYAGLVPDNAYGSVVEATFREDVSRRGGAHRWTGALSVGSGQAWRVGEDHRPVGAQCRRDLRAGWRRYRSLCRVGLAVGRRRYAPRAIARALACGTIRASSMMVRCRAGCTPHRMQRVSLSFSQRYRNRFGQEPVRTATLAYDAAALIAALVRTQGPQRPTDEMLTNSSGFAGIDGVFRFKPDGTNERGLAVLRVAAGGSQIVSPAPKSFNGSAS